MLLMHQGGAALPLQLWPFTRRNEAKGEEVKARWEKYTEEQRVIKLWFSQPIKEQVWTSRKHHRAASPGGETLWVEMKMLEGKGRLLFVERHGDWVNLVDRALSGTE